LSASGRPWVAALSSPGYFHGSKEKHSRHNTPTRSGASTPRQSRERCFESLFNDAAQRKERTERKKKEIEERVESDNRIQAETSIRATRRYRSRDNRSVLERSAEHMRRKQERLQDAEREKAATQDLELEECTFHPKLSGRPLSVGRASEADKALRRLALKQKESYDYLVKLVADFRRKREIAQKQGFGMDLQEKQKMKADFEARSNVYLNDLKGIESRAQQHLQDLAASSLAGYQLTNSGFVPNLSATAEAQVMAELQQDCSAPPQRWPAAGDQAAGSAVQRVQSPIKRHSTPRKGGAGATAKSISGGEAPRGGKRGSCTGSEPRSTMRGGGGATCTPGPSDCVH